MVVFALNDDSLDSFLRLLQVKVLGTKSRLLKNFQEKL